MTEPTVLPVRGEVVLDARGGGRALRVSWHPDHGVVVLSLWRGNLCVGTVQVHEDDVSHLVEVLVRGLEIRSVPGGRNSATG